MVSSQIVLTKAESKRLFDGYVHMAVCEFAKMKAFGWNDNNPVHVLSTADTSGPRTTVTQKRGSKQMQVPCPLAIPSYNKNMQGFDNHDQLRSRFTTASRHVFKKYYIIMQLANMDMVIMNADKLFFEANPHLKKKEGARRSFVEDIAELSMDENYIDWEGIYGPSTVDLNYGATRTPGKYSDAKDILNDVGVPNLAASHFSPRKDKSIDTCVPVSPFSQEFMDLHKSPYLERKQVTSV
jgi:hypothetical protein